MELLKALGITYLAFVQFLVFVALFGYLTGYVFIPYFRAFMAREELTKGGIDLADELQGQTASLQAEYQTKTRELTAQIQTIFQKSKTEAASESERILARAQQDATTEIENGRKNLTGVIQQSKQELQGQTHQVALMITQKLLGKS